MGGGHIRAGWERMKEERTKEERKGEGGREGERWVWRGKGKGRMRRRGEEE